MPPSLANRHFSRFKGLFFFSLALKTELGYFITGPLNTGPLDTALLSHGPLNFLLCDSYEVLNKLAPQTKSSHILPYALRRETRRSISL